jgi:hypothetical protein
MVILFSNAVARSSVMILCSGFRRFFISFLSAVRSFVCSFLCWFGAGFLVIVFSSVCFFLVGIVCVWVFNCLMKC